MGSEAINEDGMFICPVCKKHFETEKGMKSHLKDKHNKKISEMKEEYTIPVSIEGWYIDTHDDFVGNYFIQTPIGTEIIFSNISFGIEKHVDLKEGNVLVATLDELAIPDEFFKTLLLRMGDIND